MSVYFERRVLVYATSAIEALNQELRKAIKKKGHFPNEEAARKLIYLAITDGVPAWTRTRMGDSPARAQKSTSAIAWGAQTRPRSEPPAISRKIE